MNLNAFPLKGETKKKLKNYIILAILLLFCPLTAVNAGGNTELSPEEKTWLLENSEKMVLYYNVEFPPIEFASENGTFTGMGADIIKEVENYLGLQFIKVPSSDWNQHLADLKNGECAVAPTIVATTEREEYAFFTMPYEVSPVIIITNISTKGDLSMDDLGGKRIAVVSGFATESYIRGIAQNRFEIITVNNVSEGLRRVSFGEIDAFIENLAVAAYYIDLEGIPNLRVAGSTDYSFAWSIGVSRKYPLLFRAVQKAMKNIPEKKLESIRKKWINLDLGHWLAPEILRIIYTAAGFLVVLLLSLGIISYILKHRLNEKVSSLKAVQQELIKQAELLKLATKSIQAGIWDYYPAERSGMVSRERYKMLGYDYEDRQVKPEEFKKFMHPDDIDGVEKKFSEYLESDGKGLYEAEYRAMHAESYWCWVLSKGKTIEWDQEGRSSRIIGLDLNIQNLKEAQEQTVQSEARFRAIFEFAPYPILISSFDDGSYIDANRAFLENTGKERNELSNLSISDIIPEILDNPDDFYERLSKYGSVINKEAQILRKDGSCGIISYSSVLLDIHGERQVISIIIDVTEEKRAIEALKASEGKLRSIFAAMTDLIIVLDAKGKIIEIGPTNSDPLYKPADNMVGKSIYDILPADKAGVVSQYIKDSLDEKRLVVFEYDLKADGSHFWFTSSIAPLQSQHVIWVSRDISNRKKAELEREKLQDKLLQRQKLEAVGILAGGIAHDFNNMIGAIIGHAELAINALDKDSPLIQNLDRILYAAERSANLTQQLLAFARKQAITPVVFDLNESIENILKMIRRLIGEDIELLWIPGAGSCSVKMDPSQIDQILINLCVNARDAIKGNGRISIETNHICIDEEYINNHPDIAAGEYVMLTVSDNGCGIKDEDISHIFEPFFTTKGLGKGTGMGLATVYGIVKQNEGFINVDSRENEGTIFRIYIPYASQNKEDTESAGIVDIPQSKGETVLVVEDDPIFLDFIVLMLKNLSYDVISAKTPVDAISIAREVSMIDLVITDIVMPDMNGREMAENMDKIRKDIKYLYMSGYTADVIANKGVLQKGINFIQKPFSIQEIALKIRDVLDA